MATKAMPLLLVLVIAQLSFQSPLDHVAQIADKENAALLSPVNRNGFNEVATSKFSIKTKNQPPNSILHQRASPTPTLYIKTNASDCNLEGSLGSRMNYADYTATPSTLNSVLDCQQLCQRTTTCYSYSWQPTSNNCTLYNTWIGHTPGAVDVGETGLFFSDKHVVDGTIWCYSSTPFMGTLKIALFFPSP
jgi:hypothetical protein